MLWKQIDWSIISYWWKFCRAGERVVVTDTSDPHWWLGTVDGYTGYFPQRNVLLLNPEDKVYKIIKPVQAENLKLLRDQVGGYTLSVLWTSRVALSCA